MPTCRQRGLSKVWRWLGLFIQAITADCGVASTPLPQRMFSPIDHHAARAR
jgi:hypothetical protein